MKRLAIVMILVLVLALDITAHPGRTNADGCHYCRTNCEQYGLQQDEYHCHNEEAASTASSSSTEESSSSSVKTTSSVTTKEKTTATSTTASTINENLAEVIRTETTTLKDKIENDIYPKISQKETAYESSDNKARRSALYLFSLILILVLIKL